MAETKQATLAAGCFWCTEAVFQRIDGVLSMIPGYAGGDTKDPTYREVAAGNTGHAEVAQIEYDPDKISFEDLLEVFWYTHNPTTLNRQGNDVGTQYRSAIFYHDQEQKQIAERSKQKLEEKEAYDDPIVTTLEPLEKFYPAEDYHKNYYDNNRMQPYCMVVINPKISKLRKKFADKLKNA
jgi:peptide-methionine (S)-S-oxide reductase